jgi:hypothetical protein
MEGLSRTTKNQRRELNIYFDSQWLPDHVIQQDICFQLEDQIATISHEKKSLLTDDIFKEVLELKSKNLRYKWWVDSDGRDWRINCRNNSKKDE